MNISWIFIWMSNDGNQIISTFRRRSGALYNKSCNIKSILHLWMFIFSIWTSYISDINVLFVSVFKLNLRHIKVG